MDSDTDVALVVRPSGWAKNVTDALSPAHIVIALPPLIGWHVTAPALSGLAWGVFISLLCGAVPYGFVIHGVRRRTLSDIHLRERSHRHAPIAFALLAITVCVVILLVAGAPRRMDALLAALFATLAVVALVTTRWQISGHAAASAGAVSILVVCFGLWALALAPLVLLIGASRVVLGDHTPAQIAAGVLVGAVIAPTVLICLS